MLSQPNPTPLPPKFLCVCVCVSCGPDTCHGLLIVEVVVVSRSHTTTQSLGLLGTGDELVAVTPT